MHLKWRQANKKRSDFHSVFYLKIIKSPDIVTKKAKIIFTAFVFNFVNKKAPANPPAIAIGKRYSKLASGLKYPLNKYIENETADIGSIVASVLAKTPFSCFCSEVKIRER